MKLTLDRTCIQSGRLCQNCQKRYDKGEIKDIDIKIGSVLINAAKSNKYLSDITVQKIIKTSNATFVVVKKGDKVKLDSATEELNNKYQTAKIGKVIILEKVKSAKQLIKDLLGSKYIIGTSTMFIPPFSDKELKVQIKKEGMKELLMQENEVSKITKALLGMNTYFSYQ